MQLAIMIEGQNGLNWQRWKRIVSAVEDFGFCGLFRSDHFTNANPPDLDSLELWTSLSWLADHTCRIEFGPLVTPFSFRHPALTARMAAALDELSSGRLVLGVGAGWQQREHDLFGFDLLPGEERFHRFEEGLAVLHGLLRSEQPVWFEGRFYQLKGAQLLPIPQRGANIPLLIGGNGLRKTLPLAARYADEWNAVFLPPEEFARLNRRLDEQIQKAGRSPADVRRSMMTGMVFGKDGAALAARLRARGGKSSAEDLRQRGVLIGTPFEIIEQIQRLSAAGAQRLMVQWLDLDDLEGLEALARDVLPNV